MENKATELSFLLSLTAALVLIQSTNSWFHSYDGCRSVFYVVNFDGAHTKGIKIQGWYVAFHMLGDVEEFFLSLVRLYVYMCVRVHVRTSLFMPHYAYRSPRAISTASPSFPPFLKYRLFLFTIVYIDQLTRSYWDSLLSIPHHLGSAGVTDLALLRLALHGFWGSKLGSSCLHIKPFIYWAISLDCFMNFTQGNSFNIYHNPIVWIIWVSC